MKKNYLLILVIATIVPFSLLYGEWLPGESQFPRTFEKNTDLTVVLQGEYEFEASLIIPGLNLQQIESGCKLACPGMDDNLGGPVITGFISLPPTASPRISIVSVDYEVYNIEGLDTSLPDYPSPSTSAVEYEAGNIAFGSIGILRDLRIIPIHITPYRYEVASGELYVTSRITLKFSYIDGSPENPKTLIRPHSTAFKDLYRSLVWNYYVDEVDEFTPSTYVIICPDIFVSYMQDFCLWKNRKGVRTSIIPFSQIGANNYTPEIIRNFLVYAYNTWDNPPDYVLLVGDQTQAPVYSTYTADPITPFSSYSLPGNYTNDNYYGCLEGDDYLPEVFFGRFCASSPSDIMLIANKVTNYERTPYTAQTDWYTEAIMASDQTEASQRSTKLTVRNILLNDGEFTQVDTLFQTGFQSLFLGWVNEGRSFINYRGAGWDIGWSGIGVFTGDLYNLTNNFKLSIVTGIGCGAALFAQGGNCFGEAWMKSGTVNTPTGAVAFLGPTWNTHTNFNDRLDKGIFEHMWQDSLREIGPAYVAGKMDVEEFYSLYYGVPGYGDVQEVVRTMFNQYIIMSDPNLTARGAPPLQIQVEHPDEIFLGPSEVSVSVTDMQGSPLEGLTASVFIENETFDADLTDANGEAMLEVNPQSRPNQLYITVTGLDIYPYTGSVEVLANSQFVSHYEYIIDDGPGGDGLISPGETIDLTETVKNYGIETAYDVYGIMSCSSDEVTFANDSAFFGDIAVNATAVGSEPFTFTVPVDYELSELPLTLNISDDQGSQWISNLVLLVRAPVVTYNGFIVTGSLERGTTAEVTVTIGNIGTLGAINLTGRLESLDPEVLIVDGECSYENVAPGRIVNNDEDPFIIQISNYCSPNYTAHFLFTVEGDQGTFSISVQSEFQFEVCLPGEVDPGSDDLGLYYAYEEQDSIYTEAPEYRWVEISPAEGGPGTEVDLENPEQVAHVEFPPGFEWMYYGQIYDRLSIAADGFIAPGEIPATIPNNMSIPRNDDIAGMVAPLWFDLLCPVGEPGDVSYYYNQEEGSFTVEYHNWSHANTNMVTETFQVVIYYPVAWLTPDGNSVIEFYYEDVNFSALYNSTCGIESPSQSTGIEMWQDLAYPLTTHTPMPYTAIRFTTVTPEIITEVELRDEQPNVPSSVWLGHNYPNPFNPATNIRFNIAGGGSVKLAVYNIMGEIVATLVEGNLAPGIYQSTWKADSKPSGIYFIRLTSGGKVLTRKVLLIK